MGLLCALNWSRVGFAVQLWEERHQGIGKDAHALGVGVIDGIYQQGAVGNTLTP
jgi:hypothetical protein